MDLLKEVATQAMPYVASGAVGYAVAYVTGLRAVRKGMQLILWSFLNDMYARFQVHAPTAEEKRVFEDIYQVYERLADNGLMTAKHQEVLHMAESIRK